MTPLVAMCEFSTSGAAGVMRPKTRSAPLVLLGHGVCAVVVDPVDQQAATFYQHFRFEPLLDCDTVFLTMRDVRAWLA